MSDKKLISVVVPCFNEEGNVENMYNAIRRVMESLPHYDYENLFIDNASTDSTADILRRIAKQDKRIKVIINNRNFGPDRSGFHALMNTSGDAVIGLPCDFQEPPEMIPDFISKWEDGNKVVWGQRRHTAGSPLMAFTRRLYYKIIGKFATLPQYENVTGFGLMDKSVINELSSTRDPWPFVRNMIPEMGFKPFFIQYDQRERASGKTSYNFFSYVDTALNALVHTSKVPLKMAIWLGLIFSLLSFLVGVFYFVYKLVYWDSFSVGQAPLIIMVSLIASLQLFFLGILGEYVLSILGRVSFTKYVVEKERINFDE